MHVMSEMQQLVDLRLCQVGGKSTPSRGDVEMGMRVQSRNAVRLLTKTTLQCYVADLWRDTITLMLRLKRGQIRAVVFGKVHATVGITDFSPALACSLTKTMQSATMTIARAFVVVNSPQVLPPCRSIG